MLSSDLDAGDESTVLETDNGNIGALVCFDLPQKRQNGRLLRMVGTLLLQAKSFEDEKEYYRIRRRIFQRRIR